MSNIRLLVRDAGKDWSGVVYAAFADRAIAALSADPATLAELEAAYARYAKPVPNRTFFAALGPGLEEEPYDAGIVVIDLMARLVAVESTYSSPGPIGEVSYQDGQAESETWLRYHLADDWLFTSEIVSWRGLADRRRQERAARPPRDARAVFYGRPLLEFIAREVFTAFGRRASGDDETTRETLRTIHANWLLTPLPELDGACPRDVALRWRDHIGWDLQDQCERWSVLKEAPPGIDPSSFAFRYGGFGTHELVEYYGLVRELLWSCWQRLADDGNGNEAKALTLGDFVADEISRLEVVRDQWLDTPDPECHGRTPRSMIERERARLPEAMSPHEGIIDPDCPCCQMAADMPGPAFWHLDGSAMDDDFAFDLYHRTREEWEAERRQWDEHAKRFEAEWAERQRRDAASSDGRDAVWSSSFVAADAGAPLTVRLFGIGCHVAELVNNLRDQNGGEKLQPLIEQLNRDFGNFRELVQNAEPATAAALLTPVTDRFAETLAAVASIRPDLAPQCDSLTGELARFFDTPGRKAAQDFGDEEVPY